VLFLHGYVGELERTGEEVVMVYFKVLSNHSPGVTEGNNKNPQDSLCHQNLNQAPTHYKSESLPLEPTYLAQY
jgi:hypothetical protein